MTTTESESETESPVWSPVARRHSLRWRIVAWFTAIMALAGVLTVGTAWAVTRNSLAARANSDIVQEVNEFLQFAETAKTTKAPYAGTVRVVDEYLLRQRPGEGEVLLGWYENGQVLQNPGPETEPRVLDDPVLTQRMLTEASGVADTDAGEVRWGRVELAGVEGASLVVVQFSGILMRELDGMFLMILPLVLVGVLAAGGIAWLFAGWLLSPVRKLQRTAAEITDRRLARRIPVRGNDELADLATTFNGMLDRLERAFETERRFVDDAGHELRTPITVIRGHLELMGDDPAERESTLALVTTELDRMNRIVTDLLTLAKVDRPDYIQLGEPVDVAALTLDLDAHVEAIGGRRWHLDHVAEGEAILDRERITQAVLQLAANAVQHTKPGDAIHLSSRFTSADGRSLVEFAVADSGPGVPDAEKERIFDRFYRRGDEPSGSGAGLGLAIVSGIVKGHDGKVWVADSPGGGATFTIQVPTRMYEAEVATVTIDDDAVEPERETREVTA